MTNELDLIISATDKLTAPLGKMGKEFDKFSKRATDSFKKIAAGALGLFGAGAALKGALSPALKMEAALGEVASLDVSANALEKLRRTAQNFAVDFGGSATDFVRSAYDIQSAINGLTDTELSKFTNAGAVLAKATKSDAGTITNYMGTMYGIFKTTAEKMGKTKWIEQVAGQTATAVKLFKTTGSEMSSAFTALGANAQSMKISAAEQFAILGKLQATMSGSEAGTKYKSFLKGVGNAQNVLGLNFTNKDGTIKSITEILDLIKHKFGDLSKVADSDLIKKAFGSDQAASLIKLLASDVDGLKNNIDQLGHVQGMKTAMDMASKMVDPWDKLKSLLEQLRVSIGLRLTPVFAPFVEKIVSGGKAFMKWLDDFPNIARWIGYITVSAIGLGAAIAALTLITGTYRLVSLALGDSFGYLKTGLKLLTFNFRMLGLSELFALWPIALIVAGLAAIGLAVYKCWQPIKAFFTGFIDGFKKSINTASPIYKIFSLIGKGFELIGKGVSVLFGWIGKLFEPIHWTQDELNGATSAGQKFGNGLAWAFNTVVGAIELLLKPLEWLIDIFMGFNSVVLKVAETLGKMWDAFDISSPIESLKRIKQIFDDAFHNMFAALKLKFAKVFNAIVSKLNKLPGINIHLMDTTAPAPASEPTADKPSPLQSGNQLKNQALAASVKSGNISTNNNVNNHVVLNINEAVDKQQIQELINEHTQLAGAM